MNEKAKVLKAYSEYKSLSVNPNKLKDTIFQVNKFLQFDKAILKSYDEKILIEYLNSIKKDYANETYNNIKAYLKNFIKWHYVDWSSRFRNLDKICRNQKSESTYKPEDMIKESDFEKLIKAEKDIFWKAYYVTLFYGGCRASEVCILKWKDVDFDSDKDGGAFFSIYSKKNRKTFLKYLPKESSYFLRQLQNNNSEYIFINPLNNKLLDRKSAYYHMTMLSKKAIGRHIDLSILRHSIATINYNKDNIKDSIVAEQMGHNKSMKNVYTHNDRDRLKANAKKIYVGEMPQEQKNELLERIDNQDIKIKFITDFLESHLKKMKADREVILKLKEQTK